MFISVDESACAAGARFAGCGRPCNAVREIRMSESVAPGENDYAWLEYTPEGADRVKSIQLDQTSLTIGRADDAGVQIDSTKVSREHAQIVLEGDHYRLRDLHSTNGTFVNGERITEKLLAPGDVIAVADTQFSFLTDSVGHLRRMATQQMTSAALSSVAPGGSMRQDGGEVVRALRTVHEQLRLGYAPVELRTIIEAPGATNFAYLQHESPTDSPARYLHAPSHALIRLRQAQRFQTIAHCTAVPDCTRVVVPLDPWEIHEVETLIWHFEALLALVPQQMQLLISLRASDAADLEEVQQFAQDLGNMGLSICCRDFVGSHVHVESLAPVRPKMLMLAGELSEGLANKPQRRSRLRSIADACRQLEIRPVVTAGEPSGAEQQFSDLGINLFFDPTRSVASAARAPSRDALAVAACE